MIIMYVIEVEIFLMTKEIMAKTNVCIHSMSGLGLPPDLKDNV